MSSNASSSSNGSVQPCAIVIFGASGDLAKLKLIPAIYELAREKLLPDEFALVGYARTKMSDDEFRTICREAITKNSRSAKHGSVDETLVSKILEKTSYHAGNYGDEADFAKLKTRLEEIDAKHNTAGNRLFYMSTPPEAFEPIINGLGTSGLARRGSGGDNWQVGSSRVDLQACKLEYSIVSPK